MSLGCLDLVRGSGDQVESRDQRQERDQDSEIGLVAGRAVIQRSDLPFRRVADLCGGAPLARSALGVWMIAAAFRAGVLPRASITLAARCHIEKQTRFLPWFLDLVELEACI